MFPPPPREYKLFVHVICLHSHGTGTNAPVRCDRGAGDDGHDAAGILAFGAFVPYVAVVGGGVAGYLHGGDRATAAKAGALSGLIGIVPPAISYLRFATSLAEGIPYGGHWGGTGVVVLVFTIGYGIVALGSVAASGLLGGVGAAT